MYIGEIPCGATVVILIPLPYIVPGASKFGSYGALITNALGDNTFSTSYSPRKLFALILIISPGVSP